MAIRADGGSAPAMGTLLLGVHSWPTRDALLRRRTIRMLNPHVSPAVRLAFILSNNASVPSKRRRKSALSEDDVASDDILFFNIGIVGRQVPPKSLQKYLVANAFLRWASRQPYAFVGRSEDDALVNVSRLGLHLHAVDADIRQQINPAASPLLLYGIRGSWVMWSAAHMLPFCWGRPSAMCTTLGFTGPFLLWQGPLVVYSRTLTRALVELAAFNDDEVRVSANWSAFYHSRLALEHVLNPGQPPRLGIVHSGVAEDVYYSSLLVTGFSRHNLTFIHAPMDEYPWNDPRPRRKLRQGAVFHRLTTWLHLNASGLVRTAPTTKGTPLPGADARDPRRNGGAAALVPTDLLDRWWTTRAADRPPFARCTRLADKFRVVRERARAMALATATAATIHGAGASTSTRRGAATSSHGYCCKHWMLCSA